MNKCKKVSNKYTNRNIQLKLKQTRKNKTIKDTIRNIQLTDFL